MARQSFLFAPVTSPTNDSGSNVSRVRLLGLNVQRPSLERALKLLEWLAGREQDILILSELTSSEGSFHLLSGLERCGYVVFFEEPPHHESAVAVLVRRLEVERSDPAPIGFLRHRVRLVRVSSSAHTIDVLGAYVPSLGPQNVENGKRGKFIDELDDWLRHTTFDRPMIFGGDLNIIEPSHNPPIGEFAREGYGLYKALRRSGLEDAYRLHCAEQLEYSWVSWEGQRQRLDHFFLSPALTKTIVNCTYLHDTRSKKLSDHSAMLLELNEQ